MGGEKGGGGGRLMQLTDFSGDRGGVGLQGAFNIALPVALEAVLQVPVDGLLEANFPGGRFLPAQSCKLLVTDVVPAATRGLLRKQMVAAIEGER